MIMTKPIYIPVYAQKITEGIYEIRLNLASLPAGYPKEITHITCRKDENNKNVIILEIAGD